MHEHTVPDPADTIDIAADVDLTCDAQGVPCSDAHDWDAFVGSVAGDNLVQTAAWGETKRRLGFEPYSIVLREQRKIVGGALLVVKRFGPLGAIGYVARGPLLARADRELAVRALDEIEATARATGVWHLIVQPPEGGELVDEELGARDYLDAAPSLAPTATLRIDLTQSLEQTLADMSMSKRRNICNSYVEVHQGDRAAIGVFHHLYRLSAKRQRFAPLSLDYLEAQWDVLAPLGWLQLAIAYASGKPIAAHWQSVFAGHVTTRLTGWTGQDARLDAALACHWWAISRAKERGDRTYDLGGVDREAAMYIRDRQPLPEKFRSTPMEYKRRLGGKAALFPRARQKTWNPIAQHLVGLGSGRLTNSMVMRRLTQRIRNG